MKLTLSQRRCSPSGLRLIALLVVAQGLAVGCRTTGSSDSRSSQGEGTEVTDPMRVDLRTEPTAGTRYVTGVSMPDLGPVLLPDWVVNPTLGGVLGAVGVAGKNQLGTGQQVLEARTAARMEIARMLEVRVQEIGRRDVEQHLAVGGEDELVDRGSNKSNLGVGRDIADVVLAGSRQRALWFDPTNSDCYVWMVMDGSVKTRADHYVENGVSIFVANQPVSSEFRPEQPKPVEVPATVPQPQEPPMGPIEELESRLKPIESVPISEGGGNEGGDGQ